MSEGATAVIKSKDYGGVLHWTSADGTASGVVYPEAFEAVLVALVANCNKSLEGEVRVEDVPMLLAKIEQLEREIEEAQWLE